MNARELILSLPDRFKPQVAENEEAVVHLKISGENGGEFTVDINDGTCKVQEGLEGNPDCVVQTSDKTYEKLEYGKQNPQMALLMGKIKVSNIPMLIKFVQMFRRQ